ncbi:MAG: hypothetical protein H5T70_08260, partial [Chloroflexi bacterium]|nr:hypothetical protein [Chloroflexota bacterium]
TMRHFQAACVTPDLLEDWSRRYPPKPPMVPVRAKEEVISVAAAEREANWGAGGVGGRPLDEIPPSVLWEIRRYVEQHGREPSSNWIYRLTKERLPTGGFNRAKARRALELALNPEAYPSQGEAH